MEYIGIIPARYDSTRFPGKPLADINGKPMIQRVYEQCKKNNILSEVYVATDDTRIEQAVLGFNGKVIMTSDSCKTGTERCYDAVKRSSLNAEVIVNIQGDEPGISPLQIDRVCSLFNNSWVNIGTLAKEITKHSDITDPNKVKVTFNDKNEALNFSREKIINDSYNHYYKHIGIYAYRVSTLKNIVTLKESKREKLERLEQLRWIDNSYDIYVSITDEENIGIDTPEDLKRFLKDNNN